MVFCCYLSVEASLGSLERGGRDRAFLVLVERDFALVHIVVDPILEVLTKGFCVKGIVTLVIGHEHTRATGSTTRQVGHDFADRGLLSA
jgi:hypothetical protein